MGAQVFSTFQSVSDSCLVIMVKAVVLLASVTLASAQERKYARGFVRMPRNGPVEVAEITDEMRAAAPVSLDWSTKGAITAVKDQGQCGSCWAYSATEGIESGLFMTTGKLEKLSEQQIVSCDKTDGGCDGGDLPTAFDYVKKAGGIDLQSDYPDKSSKSGRTGSCKSFEKKVKVTGWKYAIPPCDSGACKNQKESDLMAALDTYGPLSVCVNAESWDDYSSVFTRRNAQARRACLIIACNWWAMTSLQIIGRSATAGQLTGERTVSF